MRKAFAIGLGGIAALAVASELVARRALRAHGRYYRYRPHQREHIQLDTAALPKHTPLVRIDINCDGERGGPPPRPGENAFRGLVVGGSAAECYFLDQSETWAAVAERILNAPENVRALGVGRAHIGSVARAIVPCGQLDYMLRRILPNYPRLDAIFIMVGAADLVRWMELGMPGSLPEEPPLPNSLFEEHPEGPWGWAPKKTALFYIANGISRGLRRPIWAVANGGSWLRRVRKMRADAPAPIDQIPDVTALLDWFASHLRGLVATAQTGTTRVILLRQPWLGRAESREEQALMWNFGLGRPYREEVTAYFSSRVVNHLMTLIDARASAVADELGIEQVEINGRIERSTRTFYDELHFTKLGAQAVGAIVADAVIGAKSTRVSPTSRPPLHDDREPL